MLDCEAGAELRGDDGAAAVRDSGSVLGLVARSGVYGAGVAAGFVLTLSRRIQVPASEVAAWEADGYREIFRLPGGMRADAEMAVMEWTPPTETITPNISLASGRDSA